MQLGAYGTGRAGTFLTTILALALAGCHQTGMLPGTGSAPAPGPVVAEQALDAPALPAAPTRSGQRPDYCPQVRTREGTETIRRYERGREDDPAHIVWQASIGETARECHYDNAGNVIVRIGVSGRVLAGPRGGATELTLPVRIAVVQHPRTVLASELRQVQAAIPADLSASFAEVHEVTVPSPGAARNYLVFVGFDEG